MSNVKIIFTTISSIIARLAGIEYSVHFENDTDYTLYCNGVKIRPRSEEIIEKRRPGNINYIVEYPSVLGVLGFRNVRRKITNESIWIRCYKDGKNLKIE